MDYEKKYKEALERARIWRDKSGMPKDKRGILDEIFPELRESEDEKIRKAIIKGLGSCGTKYWGGFEVAKALSWLEKQGEKPILSNSLTSEQRVEEAMRELEEKSISYMEAHKGETADDFIALCRGEQKPADKVEPRFKVGDWITDGYVGGQITSIEDNYPCYKIADFMGGINTSIPFTLQDNYHLWTIQDAKDGDVLTSAQVVFIFKMIHGVWLNCYCSSHNDGSFMADSYDLMINKYFGEVYPATKEQRDLLFQKMKEAGYEWDADTKELKKIDARQNLTLDGDLMQADSMMVKSSWSEKDEKNLSDIILFVKTGTYSLDKEKLFDWLKSLKDRLK